jgi:spermidine synthase
VPIEVSEEAGVRYLHFGSRWVQGAMRIQRPFALELEYTRAMMAPLLLHGARDWPRQVLLIGLGAASLTKFLYRHRPRAALTVVEIEPKVVAVARQFFRLPDDPRRLTIEIGNGDAWLAANEGSFDLILVDGFDARGSPGSLDSSGFYRRCRDRLSDRGLVVTNLLTRTRGVAASLARQRQAFDDRVLALPAGEAGNTVAIGAAGEAVDVRVRELVSRAARLRADTGLDLKAIVAALAREHGGPGGVLTL